MKDIIEKLDSYQILTNLLPGVLFGIFLKFFLNLMLPTQNIGEDIVVYYFIGLFINRIGSLVVEPILKKLNFITFIEYSDFIKAERSDSKITILSEMNNYTRSLLTCILLVPIVLIIQLLRLKLPWFLQNCKWGIMIFFAVLLLFSYRKQTAYIRKRVLKVNMQKERDIK